MGRGGALVETTPFDRRVVSSNPTLVATWGPLASPSLACSDSACKTPTQCQLLLSGAPLSSSGLEEALWFLELIA